MKRTGAAIGGLAVIAALFVSSAAPSGAAESDRSGEQKVSVVSGTLSVLGFGARVGLPLLCSSGFGVLTAAVPHPTVAGAGAQVAEGCVTFGAEGSEGFAEMNKNAAGLAVLNPVLDPGVATVSGAFITVGKSGGPFGQSFVELGNAVAFFHS